MIITSDGITEVRTYGRRGRRVSQVDKGTEHRVVNANGGGELQNTTIDHGGRIPQLFYVNCASWTGIGTYSLDYIILDSASGKLGTFPSVW